MTRNPVSHPIDTLWQAPAIIWAILAGECLALVLALSPGVEANRLVLFGLASFLIQWVILLTLGTLYALRSWIRRLRPLHVAWLGLLGLLLWAWAAIGTVHAFLGPAVFGTLEQGWQWPLLRVTGIVVAVGILGLAALHNHWQAQKSAVRAKHAELESLQARTHPHFLFNSLNTAIALVHQRPTEAESVLLDLSDLFRAALSGPQQIALLDEIDLTRRYLQIEQLRLGERLAIDWELPPVIPDVEVPALSIQPLAENAIRHGIERRVGGGRISILVTSDDTWLHVTVRNDLPDGAESAAATGHGVGIPSVASRVDAMTGGLGTLTTGSRDGRYTATIRLPVDNGS